MIPKDCQRHQKLDAGHSKKLLNAVQVRKAMDHVGLVVSRLIRVLFGPIRLQGIKELELQPLSLAERVALSKAVNMAAPPQKGQTDQHGTL